MELVDLPEMSKGDWKIESFVVDQFDFCSAFMGRNVPMGRRFTKVTRGNTLVMSDTPAEQKDHNLAVHVAKGSCLLNGLGIGMVLKNILLKKGS